MENPVIITVAVTGSRPTKEMNPAVPITPKEIIQAAVDCCHAGAAIAHIHVRDPETGRPAFKMELFKEVLEGIRERCDMLVNLTTSGFNLSGPDVIARRLQPVSLKPDLCSFDLGSVNFADHTFVNPPEWGYSASRTMQEARIKPEIEVFDVGHIAQAIHLIDRDLIDDPPYFQLCMGIRWGIEATPENLMFMKSKLPADAVWSVLGVGKDQLPMIATGLILGGNVRVGFEDNIYFKRGVLAESNAQMVEKAATLAEQLHRPLATPEAARKILNIA
jgi:3-keto-5-aminohexanoate cleavage enzyme